ncbi:MAG: lysophospholipase, partial [Thermotogaceae bacterium]|nr:lysophospholipase [Thermotogaceae bacterium]
MTVYIREEGISKDRILLIHGLGEHSGRYEKFIKRAIKDGFSVLTFDLPGHGKSRGIRGHAPLKKVFNVIENITKNAEKPFVVFGHSLGGLIAARYVENGGKAKMLVLSSPGFDYDRKKVSNGLVNLAKILSAIIPFLPMNNRINPNLLSRNKEAVYKYTHDPLVHDKISVALARDFFVESQKAIEEADKINIPTLVLIGTDDKVTPPEGARNFFENLESKDKKIIEYKGAYHEIFEDPEYSDKFYDDIFN